MLGQRLHNFAIMRLLGEGGMSSVYEAEHALIRRKVAVKVLRSELSVDGVQVQRFFNEARATSAIRHPNIVEVIDVGRLPDGVPYLVMELLEGESLGDRLERIGPLDIPLAIDYARQAASALEAAHALKVVHRDLKPDNLFLVPDPRLPDRELVKVLDFGIAKLRGELAAPPFDTLVGAVLGTPPYMSPEQCRGLPEEIDERTDVYALGIILYEMVCGQPPFMADGAGELMMLHMTADPEPPSHARPELPPALEDAILRALEKRREDRFPSMAEFGAALAEIAGSHGLPEPSGVRRSNPAAASNGRAAFESTEPALMFNGDLERERAVTRALARRASMPTDTASGVVRLSPEDHAAAAAFARLASESPQAPVEERPDQSSLRPSRAAPPVVGEPPRSAGDRRSEQGSRPSGASLAEPPRSPGEAPPVHSGLPARGEERRRAPLWAALAGAALLVGSGLLVMLVTRQGPADAHQLETAHSAARSLPEPAPPPAASPTPVPSPAPAPVIGNVGAPRAAPEPAEVASKPAHRPRVEPHPRAAQPSAARRPAPATATALRRDPALSDNPPPAAAAPEEPAVAAEPGYLSLDSSPWSDVFLGGERLGTTPLIHVPLPPGKHMLTLRNPELGVSTSYAVEIQSGKTLSRLVGWERR